MKLSHILLLVSLTVLSRTVFADALLDQARNHIDTGNPQLAWELLAPLNSERAGEVEYDYLLGIAALDTGRNTEAVFALERVLAVQPDHSEARAEIARAYLVLNETHRAKDEFNKVLEDDSVPVSVQAQISGFLTAIEEIETDKKTDWNVNLSLSIGNDDNVNSGPVESQIAVPLLGGAIITLDDTSLPQESTYSQTLARVNMIHHLDDNSAIVAGLGIAHRENHDATQFNNTSLDGNIGYRVSKSKFNHFTTSLQTQQFYLDGEAYRNVSGLLAQWRNRISSHQEVSVYGKYSQIAFETQTIRDADRFVVGAGFSQFFAGKSNPLLYLGLYSGEEKEQASGVTHLGQNFWGVKIGTQTKLSQSSVAFLSLSSEYREYGGADPLFLVVRDDNQLSASAGIRIKKGQHWSFSPEVNWSQNISNIATNENEKLSYAITARYSY